jgi:hypothetical protein
MTRAERYAAAYRVMRDRHQAERGALPRVEGFWVGSCEVAAVDHYGRLILSDAALDRPQALALAEWIFQAFEIEEPPQEAET